ncbi:Capsular polysaccharide type 8 biosynthesis protein cap8A [Slackia heliotrinireducens]|uniref:Capsular polysaccharide biosynthesis protein n=1 Tax=Slackia heliotrinireducens (strain ATCC 29202 / DSM 20476 / NCTC 11029 / RHS 1) TaxID=471855 RepID=C7N5W8_SLAHD|nr:Wzz/FepE/Etk N-terminal domain-containing protein [Slackia heliotrinireducens]ACV22303.1 capsular polysaccharide biosynthesis protein [Slackia heliotrinireducens DSM 20476]VEH00510.1 Capsular polysaccharide type 8 biosynthesis protein cap8A [Slackia heliotrinireducens]
MTLLELLHLLRERLALVVALPVIFGLIAAIVCWGFMPNQYTAEVSIYALAHLESSSQNGDYVTSSDLSASQMLANDFAELAKNEQVQSQTADVLGLENLNDYEIQITSSTTTRVIKVAVTSEDPDSAALVANELVAQLSDAAIRVMEVEAVNVVSDAKAPTSPSGPNRLMYAMVAVLAGLFLAIALVVLEDMLNTTVRSDQEVQELLGLPVIGRYPLEKGGRR